MDEDPETRARIDNIEDYRSAHRQHADLWTEDDTLILLHLQDAIEAGRRQGYSEVLLHETLTALYAPSWLSIRV